MGTKKSQILWGERQPRQKQSIFTKTRRYRKLIGALFLFFCFSVFVFGFVFGPWLQVKHIEIVSQDALLDADSLKRAVLRAAIQEIWFLHTANIFLVNLKLAEKALRANFPEIKTASISRRPPHTLVITLEKRSERAVYCAKEIPDRCYFIDETGIAWKDAPQISGLVQTKIIGEKIPLRVGMGTIPQDLLEKIFYISTRIQEAGKFSIEQFSITSLSEIEATASLGFSFFIDPAESQDEQLNALRLILQKEIPEEKWGNVEYIDLRIPNRVYYKMKNE